jgi:hypothetical protein
MEARKLLYLNMLLEIVKSYDVDIDEQKSILRELINDLEEAWNKEVHRAE